MLSHRQCVEQDIVLGANPQLCPDGSQLSTYVLPIDNNGTRARWIQTSQQGSDIRKEKQKNQQDNVQLAHHLDILRHVLAFLEQHQFS